MALQIIPVSSSMIAAAAYDPDAQELEITFKSNGARWRYGSQAQPLDQAEADAFAGAGSAGAYFLSNIKGSYPERRV